MQSMQDDGGPARALRGSDWVLALGGAAILADAFDAPLYALFGWRATLLPGLPIARLLLPAVFAAAAVLLAADPRRALDCVRATALLWPAVALAFVSAIWSERPATTLLWSAALLGTSAFGIALAVRFSVQEQSVLTAAAVSCIAIASALIVMLWPAFGVGRRDLWRGVYVYKNLLGRCMALGVVAAAVTAFSKRRRVPALVAVLLCSGVLLGTRSRASILSAVVAIAAALVLLAARTWRRQAFVILASGALMTVLVVAVLLTTRPGLAFLGRDETLSARTTIWKGVTARAMQRPWLGHGYGAFWTSPVGQERLPQMARPVSEGHNGVVDLFAELGVVGLILVLVPLGVFAAAAVRFALQPGACANVWPATYLVFFVASNAAESAFLRHKLYWALYVAAASYVANGRRPAPRSD